MKHHVNVEDGFCLLLPDGYAVDDSLTTENGGGETAVYVDTLQDAAETAGYHEARLAWNRKVVQHPAVIVAVESVADVQTAVSFARQINLGVAVQSTGHGNVRPADDCLLILTTAMNNVVIDPTAQTATIEAGAKWGAVLAAAGARARADRGHDG